MEGERYEGRERMIKAYETETGGHGTYWQVFKWVLGQEQDTFIADMENVYEAIRYARERGLPITLYSTEWHDKLQKEGENE